MAENRSAFIRNWIIGLGPRLEPSTRPQYLGFFLFFFSSILDKVEYIYNRESPQLRERHQMDHVKTCHGSVLYGRRRLEDTNRHGELALNELLMCDYNEALQANEAEEEAVPPKAASQINGARY